MGKRLANRLQLAVGMISYPMITAHTGNSSINADPPLPINVHLLRRQLITDSANSAARKMYESCGAKQLARTYYRLFDDGLIYAAG
jgi:hypothetical protein